MGIFIIQHLLLYFSSCRHPDPTKRPELNNILKVMVRNVDLNELPIDKEVNKQAAILGVPLEAAANLYHDLQTLYCKE